MLGDNRLMFTGVAGVLVGFTSCWLSKGNLTKGRNHPVNMPMMIENMSRDRRAAYLYIRNKHDYEQKLLMNKIIKQWVSAYTTNLSPEKLALSFIDEQGVALNRAYVTSGNFQRKARNMLDDRFYFECTKLVEQESKVIGRYKELKRLNTWITSISTFINEHLKKEQTNVFRENSD